MKTPLLLCLAISLSAPHDLTSKHEKGQVRRTSFSFEEERSMVEMSATVNGEEQPAMEGMSHIQTSSGSGLFVDSTTRVEDSECMAFERVYEELEYNASLEVDNPFGEGMSEVPSFESELEGMTVRFTRDDGDFVAEFPEEDAGDEELLEDLVGELPWDNFLPAGSVEDEAEWEIESETFFQTLDLGGDLSFEADEEGALSSAMASDNDGDADYSGEVTATLISVSEVDGRMMAKISLEVDASKLEDNTESARAQMEERGQPDDAPEGALMPELESMEVEIAYEGEGTLMWDVEGGYLVSLEMELELEASQTMEMFLEFGGQTMEIEQVMAFEGKHSIEVEVEVESN